MASHMSRGFNPSFPMEEVALNDAILSKLFTVSYNRPNPSRARKIERGTLGRL